MTPRDRKRDRLLQEGSATYRRYVSGQVLSAHATAEAVGLNATDFFVLNYLALAGPLTAGQLARRTGLTTGATTRMIDRLERGRFVRRDRQSADRRQVVVEIAGDRQEDLDAALAPTRTALYKVFQRYTADEVRTLMDYFTRAGQALLASVEDRHTDTRDPVAKQPHP
jgi:DNA-binding MarR family transcriptional regulator